MTSPGREYSRAWFASEARPFTSIVHHHHHPCVLGSSRTIAAPRDTHATRTSRARYGVLLHPGKHRITREGLSFRSPKRNSHSAPSSKQAPARVFSQYSNTPRVSSFQIDQHTSAAAIESASASRPSSTCRALRCTSRCRPRSSSPSRLPTCPARYRRP